MSEQPTYEAVSNRFIGALLGVGIGDSLGLPAKGLTPYVARKRFHRMDGSMYKDLDYSFISKSTLVIADEICKSSGIDHKNMLDRLRTVAGSSPDADPPSAESMIRHGSGMPPDKVGDPVSTSPEFLPRMIAVGVYAAATGIDGGELGKACRKVCSMTHASNMATLSGWVVAKMVRDAIRNFKDVTSPYEWYQSDKSLLPNIIGFVRMAETSMHIGPANSLSDRLLFVRRRLQDGTSMHEMAGLVGNRQGVEEVMPFSVFCFLSGPDSFNTVVNTATMGGASPCCAALVGGMVGSYAGFSCFPEDVRKKVRNSDHIVSLGQKLAEVFDVGHMLGSGST